MKTYKKSLGDYIKLLEDTRKDIENTKLDLQDFLSSNTGKRTTKDVNKIIMTEIKNMQVLGYNERFYEAIVKELREGTAVSKV